jgi:hypothetical protein
MLRFFSTFRGMNSVIDYLESHIPDESFSTYKEWLLVRHQGRSLIGLWRDRYGVKGLRASMGLLISLESAWDIRDHLMNLM